jgi:hypothetical protein
MLRVRFASCFSILWAMLFISSETARAQEATGKAGAALDHQGVIMPDTEEMGTDIAAKPCCASDSNCATPLRNHRAL